LRIADFLADTLVADIVILAKLAQQAAVGKEYGSGTMYPDKRGFFSKVRMETGNPCLFTRLAYTRFLVAGSVDIALTGAQAASMQSAGSLQSPLFEFSRMISSHIGRFKISHE
jgi:hypothetical protein